MNTNTIQIFQTSDKYVKGVKIPFDAIFNSYQITKAFDLQEHEHFDMSPKDTYGKRAEFIIRENNEVIKLDDNNQILTNYLILKYRTDKLQFTSPDIFIEYMISGILQPWFLRRVHEYVVERYKRECPNQESKIQADGNRYSDIMTFNDIQTQYIYEISVIDRFLIPLITHFIKMYAGMLKSEAADKLYTAYDGRKYSDIKQALTKGNMFNKTEFLLTISRRVLEAIQPFYVDPMTGEPILLYSKIHTFIRGLIRGESVNDGDIWNKLAMQDIDTYTMTNYIIDKIFTDIIPKAEFNQPIMPCIVMTTTQTVNWQTHEHFTLNYNMVSQVSEDSDFSDADRFEMNSVKIDEAKKILVNNFTEDTINIIFKRRGFVLDQSEYDFYFEHNNPISEIQNAMVRDYFAIPFGGWENLDGLNKIQFTKILICLIHTLKLGGKFTHLPYILTGKVVSMNEKRQTNTNLERKMKQSITYKQILERFTYTGKLIEEKQIIEQNIQLILNCKMNYNEYDNDLNGTEIVVDPVEIYEEYLKFITMLP
jgi:hypothetical protein